MSTLSVTVIAHNERRNIEACLASVLESAPPCGDWRVLVVDDGSSDDTYDKALAAARASRFVPVRVITKKNGGKADALNTGMMHARGEFILNMDGDTKLSPNTLRACIRHFQDPRIGAVARGATDMARRRAMRSSIGGCVENRLAMPPPDSGLKM